MALSVAHILDLIALIFAVFSFIPIPVPNGVLVGVAVILLAIAGLIS